MLNRIGNVAGTRGCAFSLRITEQMPKRTKISQKEHSPNNWSPEFLQVLGSCPEKLERPASQPIGRLRDPFGDTLDWPSMSHDAAALLNDVLLLPENERLELASRLFAQE